MNIGKRLKVLVPWKRPENISKKNSKSISFAFHAIKWFEKNYGKLDVIILLQPTSPFRSLKTFYRMYKKFLKKKNQLLLLLIILKNKRKYYTLIKILLELKKKKIKRIFIYQFRLLEICT